MRVNYEEINVFHDMKWTILHDFKTTDTGGSQKVTYSNP